MNNLIKILPQPITNRIAAGEVVARPESVVKELIENSLDAGADEIILIIKDAGKSLIQVIDNGTGMNKDDAILCFERHSTSKISSSEDLENIKTLGFRGEALASICSVSQIELKTNTKDSEIGTYIKIEGNELAERTEIAVPQGTNISVKNLFFNTPARRNFFKSNQTEFRHIYDTFIRLTISHPDVSFKFISNDTEIFSLEKSKLNVRINDVFSGNINSTLLKVESESSLIKINGYVTKPNFVRKSKQEQMFFLNKRFITNKNLNYAVFSAYDQLLEKGSYPAFFLFIILDTSKVDVNVHPSKLEVRFEDESAVFNFIRNAIKKALQDSDLTFDIGFENQIKSYPETDMKSDKPDFRFTSSPLIKPTPNILEMSSDERLFHRKTGNKDYISTDSENGQTNIFVHKKTISDSEAFNVWQFKSKYIMFQTETGLMIIDQHAAHERVIYEKATKMMNSHSSFSQQLLIPLQIKLTKIDYQLCINIMDELKDLGFNFTFLDNDVVEVTGIPFDVKIGEEHIILEEILSQYKEYEMKLNLEKRDNIAKSFACKSAIKTGELLTKTEILNLIDSLFACEMPYVCPHGRPTVIRITTEELDKRFSRT